jgi:hypothetical protein
VPVPPTIAITLSTSAPPLGLPAWAPWALILLGAVMLATWWTGSKRAAANTTNHSFAKRLLRSANAARASAPQSSLDSETTQLVDDLCARLDERAARLEALLVDAKASIARLEALHASTPPPSAPRARRAAKHNEPPLLEVVAQTSVGARGAQSPSDPLCARVYELADSGADAVEIAKQLSEHTGKVQLILALRGQ